MQIERYEYPARQIKGFTGVQVGYQFNCRLGYGNADFTSPTFENIQDLEGWLDTIKDIEIAKYIPEGCICNIYVYRKDTDS